jgi:hypothetical protein
MSARQRREQLEHPDFDRWLSQSEKTAREDTARDDDRFMNAMARAVRRGRERAIIGTFVDTSYPVGALHLRGDVAVSACGSPAQMCAESASLGGATSTLK